MKRFVLLAALAAAGTALGSVGCSGSKMNSPFTKKAPAAASTAKPNYFEVKKNKKTYVLSSPESIQALNKGETSLSLKEMAAFGPKGETVAFENNGFTDLNRLVAEYKKNHNLQ